MAHREWIGGRVVTLLSHYWRDDDDEMLTAAIAADWAEVLEGLPQDAIQKACIKYQRQEGRRKPTPGTIYAMARDFMPKLRIAKSEFVAPEKDKPCSAEVAQRICEEYGYTPKKFGGNGNE